MGQRRKSPRNIRKRASKQRGDQVAIEPLEDRWLLVGPHDAQLVSELTTSLRSPADLRAFIGRLSDSAVLNQSLPLTSESHFGADFDPATEFSTQINQLSSGYASFSALEVALNGIPGVSVVASRDLPDNLELDLRFQATSSYLAALSNNFGETKIQYDANLTATEGYDLHLNVGAFWDANSNSAVFYLNADSSLHSDIDVAPQAIGTGPAVLGFVDVDVTGGNASMNVDFDIALHDPGDSGEGLNRLTLQELAETSIDNLLSTSVTSPAGSEPKISLDMSHAQLGPETIQVDWPTPQLPDFASNNIDSLADSGLYQFDASDVQSEFESLSDWFSELNKIALTYQSLPVLGGQLGEVANLGGLFQNSLVTGVGNYSSAADLAGLLPLVDGLNLNSWGISSDRLKYDISITTTQTQPIELDFPGIDLRVFPMNPLQLDVDVRANVVLAFDLSTGQFFLEDSATQPELSISTALDLPSINAPAAVGFLSGEVLGGSASIVADVDIDLVNADGSSRIKSEELAGLGGMAGLIDRKITGHAQTSLAIDSAPAGIAAVSYVGDWPDFGDPEAVFDNPEVMADFAAYEKIKETQFSVGLDQLEARLDDAANSDLGGSSPWIKPLPLVGQTPGELIGLSTIIENTLTSHTEIQFADDSSAITKPFTTSDQLLDLLENLPGVGAGNVSYTVNSDDIRYTLHLDNTINNSVPLSLDLNDASTSIDMKLSGTADFILETDLDVVFGVRRADGKFFVAESGTPTFQALGSMTVDLEDSSRWGYLDVDITGESGTLPLNLNLSLLDPASDEPATPGLIFETEWANIPSENLLQASGSGNATLNVPLSASLGAFTPSGTMNLAWPDVFAVSPVLTVDTSMVTALTDFNSIQPVIVNAGFSELPRVLQETTGQAGLGRDLGLVGGSLGPLINLEGTFSAGLPELIEAESAQELKAALETAFGTTSSVAVSSGNDVQFSFNLEQNFSNKPIGVHLEVPGLSFQGSATARTSGQAGADLTIGVSFDHNLPADERFYLVEGGSSVDVAFKVTTPVPVGGKASAGLAKLTLQNSTAIIAGPNNFPNEDAVVTLPLSDPGGAGSRITLAEMKSDPSLLLTTPATVDGVAEFDVHIVPLSTTPGGKDPSILATWASIGSVVPTNAVETDFDSITQAASDFDYRLMNDGLQSIVDMIDGWSEELDLQVDLPFFDAPLLSIFDIRADLRQFFTLSTANGATTAVMFDAAMNANATQLGNNFTLHPHPDVNEHDTAPASGSPKFRYLLEYQLQSAAAAAPFDIGSDLFTLDTTLTPDVEATVLLEFGLNEDDGFFIVDRDVSSDPISPSVASLGDEIQLGLTLNASPTAVNGEFGPVTFGVKDGSIDVQFDVGLDLVDSSGSDGKISAAQLVANSATVLDSSRTGVGSLELPMGAYLGNDGFGFKTWFGAAWDASRPDEYRYGNPNPEAPETPSNYTSTNPRDGFSSVHYETGEVIRTLVGPWIEQLAEKNPLKGEFLSELNTEIPLIDQTPLELAGDVFADDGGIGLLLEINSILQQYLGLANAGFDISLPAGEYGTLTGSSSISVSAGSATGGTIPDSISSLLTKLSEFNVTLPILDSMTGSVVDILLSDSSKPKHADLVKWDPPRVAVEDSYETTPIPVFVYGAPSVAEIRVSVSAFGEWEVFADLDVGLSTRGLFVPDKQGNNLLLNGFYVGDNLDGSDDAFEVGVSFKVGMEAEGDVKLLGFLDIAEITIDAGVRGTIGVDIADLDGPVPTGKRVGKTDTGGDDFIHFDEMDHIVNGGGPESGLDCLITLGGELAFFLELEITVEILFVEVFSWSTELDITLVDWEFPCGPTASDVAKVVGNRLVMHEDPNTGFEGFDITVNVIRDKDSNPTSVRISKTNTNDREFEEFPIAELQGVTKLEVLGSRFDDNIRIDPTLTEIELGPNNYITEIEVIADAGPEEILLLNVIPFNLCDAKCGGNDKIDFGPLDSSKSKLVSTYIEGGDGNDVIIGTFAADHIKGDNGHDQILGYGSDDTLNGGGGHDTISGGAGVDNIVGGSGNDEIFGDSGKDFLNGGHGNDRILGGGDADEILGGFGNDTLVGGQGNDKILGGFGDDLILGQTGLDFLFGGDGDDEIRGEDQNDYLEGGPGSDQLVGGDGEDLVVQQGDYDHALYATELHGLEGIDTLDTIERVELRGGAGANHFEVGGWLGNPVLVAGEGGFDTVAATVDDNVTLAKGLLRFDNGTRFTLDSIEHAELNGGEMDNEYRLDHWTQAATINGGGGIDAIVAQGNHDFTISDTTFGRTGRADVTLIDLDRVIVTGGPGNNEIDASGFSGQAWLYGRHGNDTLRGGSGDDFLDGGTGDDLIIANGGDDELLGGGGANDLLYGGTGNDLLRGSDDGGDLLSAGPGNDIVLGNAGNDTILGGSGDDRIEGGSGDDEIVGDGGSDIIVGGPGHDTIYGHNTVTRGDGSQDDNAVDYLYGDFGTNANELDSGDDRLHGQGGNDRHFGEGGDDFIDVGAGVDDRFDYGADEGTTPSDFTPPIPTTDPSLGPADVEVPDGAKLPNDVEFEHRWQELAGSATAGGLSGGFGQASDPTVASNVVSTYVAWADRRDGTSDIYVARSSALGWEELAGSAHGSGISGAINDSYEPSIALASDGLPIIAWTEFRPTGLAIHVAKYDAAANAGNGQWIALGNSLNTGGISNSPAATRPQVVNTALGPVVAYVDETSGNVFVKRFNGGVWSALGPGAASGNGVTNSSSGVAEFSLATDGAKVAVAWTQSVAGVEQILLTEWTGPTWTGVSNSDVGTGVSGTLTASRNPSVAYHGGALFVAWQELHDSNWDVYVKRHDTTWNEAGPDAASTGGLSRTTNDSQQPQLASGGSDLHLIWTEDSLSGQSGNSTAIQATKWNGSAFAAELPADKLTGVHPQFSRPVSLALSVDNAGNPTLAFDDLAAGGSEIYVRTNRFNINETYYVNDQSQADDVFTTAPGAEANSGREPNLPLLSVQDVLDKEDLGPGDVILVDSGSYTDGFTVGADDSGVTILGFPDFPAVFEPTDVERNATKIHLSQADDVRLHFLDAFNPIEIDNSDRVGLYNNVFRHSVTIDGGADLTIAHNRLKTVALGGSNQATTLQYNDFRGSETAIEFFGSGAFDISILDNLILAKNLAIDLDRPTSGTIADNRISNERLGGFGVGIDIRSPFTGPIERNQIHQFAFGVKDVTSALLVDNRIFENGVGVQSLTGSPAAGLGYNNHNQNDIFKNWVGVFFDGGLRAQFIHHNDTGVFGSGIVGGDHLDDANLIVANDIGVDTTNVVQFNRIARNTVGIQASEDQRIHHNLIYRNTTTGVQIDGSDGVSIVDNTFYSPLGDNIHLLGAATNTLVHRNIMWAESGYNIHVEDESQVGFDSDFNVLHASGDGKLVRWSNVTFRDILDWQEDYHEHDLHSVGYTVVNPVRSQPVFLNKTRDDYRVFDTIASRRSTSPSKGASSPRSDEMVPHSFVNLLANPSFENELADWTTNNNATVQSSGPLPHEGASYFAADNDQLGFAMQTVDLLAAGFSEAALDAQDLVAVFGGRVQTAAEDAVDRARLQLRFLDAGNNELTSVDVSPIHTTTRWEQLGEQIVVPIGARKAEFRFESDRITGTTADNYVDRAFLYVLSENVLLNAGAYANEQGDPQPFAAPQLEMVFPDLYTDWEKNRPLNIRWDSFGNDSDLPVRIELFQDGPDGPTALTTIVASTLDDGFYEWIPSTDGIDFNTHGLRIGITLVGEELAFDWSTETFSVPQDGTKYFVNDAIVNSPGLTTAMGSNRNTGKSPADPKPYPHNVLRRYTLLGGDELFVDDGAYQMLHPLVISGDGFHGDDEGFAMIGSTTAVETQFFHANTLADAPIVEVRDADFVTISNAEMALGQIGLLIGHGSTAFTGTNLELTSNDLDGLRVQGSSEVSLLDDVRAVGNGENGVFVDGLIEAFRNGVSDRNGESGLIFIDPGDVAIENNSVELNGQYGIYVDNFGNGVQAVVGHANLSAARGNHVQQNGWDGIRANGDVLVSANTVANHIGHGRAGIHINHGANAINNVVHTGFWGIRTSSGGQVERNRAYDHAAAGIYIQSSGAGIRENVAYSNAIGIEARGGNYDITNNLSYANSDVALILLGTGNVDVVNNTIHQLNGDGIRAELTNTNLELRNNIVSVQSGIGISVATSSQSGFTSDYNLIHANSLVGRWQDIDQPSLASWRSATAQDANSFSTSPDFVDANGTDNYLGHVAGVSDGFDDDFHLRSSSGSFHGGSLSPILGGNGLPTLPNATLTIDGSYSPAIDRGASGDVFSNETLSNGGYVNLGHYGNTAQASRSPLEYLLPIRPDAGETWPADQTFPIEWRSHDLAGTVDILLLSGGVLNQLIADDTANDGKFDWSVPNSVTPGDYQIQIVRNDGNGQSNSDVFQILPPITEYYVNDSTVEIGDWTTAPGDDANDGLTPSTPKATIQSVLQSYVLGSGDTIRVDAGDYTVTSNIVVTAADAGVVIRGFSRTATVLDRGNLAAGNYVFELQNADDIVIRNLKITGANRGVYASSSSDSDDVSLLSNDISLNNATGVFLDNSNDGVSIVGNTLAIQQTGIQIEGDDAVISSNVVRGSTTGIRARGTNAQLSQNELLANSIAITLPAFSSNTTVTENSIHNNGGGISGGGFMAENILYDNTGTAISASPDSIVEKNIVHSNQNGILSSGSVLIDGNRVYQNQAIGISANGSTILNNTVFGNDKGIRSATSTIMHNLLFDHITSAVEVTGNDSIIEQNTIYEPRATGVHLNHGSNSTISNNIFWVEQAAALSVDRESQTGVTSNHNLFWTPLNGSVALWAGESFDTVSAWALELGFDQDSLQENPEFVDPLGADGILGWADNGAQGAADYSVDNDFHLQSVFGSYHNGSLSGVLVNDQVQVPTGIWVNDASHSGAIDAANPLANFAHEMSPNGERANIGAYGNTPQASRSNLQAIDVLEPNGWEKFEPGQDVAVRWQSHGLPSGTVDIELRDGSEGTLIATIESATVDDGEFDWQVPTAFPDGNYVVRVVSNAMPSILDETNNDFQIAPLGNDYYVNVAGCGAPFYLTVTSGFITGLNVR